MGRWPTKKNSLQIIQFMALAAALVACGATHERETAQVGSPENPTDDASLESLLQGLRYIRENPSEREDERISRFLYVDHMVSILEARNRMTPELGQSFWEDLSSFVKEPPMGVASLERIVARTKTKLGSNVARYQLYVSALKESSVEVALGYLQQVEEDPYSDLYARAQELLKLQGSQASAEARRFGVLVPLRGEFKSYGEEVLSAIQLVSNFAASEGIEFVVADAGENDADLLDAFQKLVLDEKVSVILGPVTSTASEFIFERAEILKVPVVSLAPRERLQVFGNYGFRSGLTLDDQIRSLSRMVREDLHARRVAMMYPDSNFGWDAAKIAEKNFEEAGLELKQVRVYPEGATDFKDPLKQMARLDVPRLRADEVCPKNGPAFEGCVKKIEELPPLLDFEVLFVPDFADAGGYILPTLPFLRMYGVQVIGLSGFNSPKLLERAQDSAEGLILTDGFFSGGQDIQTRLFVERYKALHGAEPQKLAAEAFDAGMLITDIMKRLRGAVSRETVRSELERVRDFPGVTGRLYSDGARIRKQPRILVVRNKKFREFR